MRLCRYQNLNDGKNPGSAFWNGRAWLFGYDALNVEWLFGRKSSNFSTRFSVGSDESDRGLSFSFGLPWLFSIYITICHFFPKPRKHREFSFYYFGDAIWLRVWGDPDNSHRDDPWYAELHNYPMPWESWYLSYETLNNKMETIYKEESPTYWQRLRGVKRGKDGFVEMREREVAVATVSEVHPYRYTLKSGEVQHVQATVNIERRTWCKRWFPWMQRSSTCINFSFSAEVGEETGSWKGGCIGSGYDLLPNETALQCLRRMEAERKF